jgi:hypothetical protein
MGYFKEEGSVVAVLGKSLAETQSVPPVLDLFVKAPVEVLGVERQILELVAGDLGQCCR